MRSALKKGLPQRQLSKEFVRQWLIDNGFMGKKRARPCLK